MKINISDTKDSGETELNMVSYMYIYREKHAKLPVHEQMKSKT